MIQISKNYYFNRYNEPIFLSLWVSQSVVTCCDWSELRCHPRSGLPGVTVTSLNWPTLSCHPRDVSGLRDQWPRCSSRSRITLWCIDPAIQSGQSWYSTYFKFELLTKIFFIEFKWSLWYSYNSKDLLWSLLVRVGFEPTTRKPA